MLGLYGYLGIDIGLLLLLLKVLVGFKFKQLFRIVLGGLVLNIIWN